MGLVALGVYASTLAPGLTWAHDSADGGELAAAAHTLGIAHPPGYPTYLLLAHVFTHLPIGEVATRTNLLSAFCAAGTAALVTWVLAQLLRCRAVALGTGLALAFSPLIWSQATVTEVHSLNGFFAALLLAFAALAGAPSRRAPRQTAVLALAIGGAWGISLGNHPTVLFCGPLAILALLRLHRFAPLGIVGLALGLAVYAYLPLRAATGPPLNWGDPRTLERFRWVVSGALYRPFVFSLPLAHIGPRLSAWASLLTRQFSWIGVGVVALGAAALWTADRSLLLASGATVVLCSVFAIGYDATDSYLYLVPALVCAGLWLGVGADWLIGAAATRAGWVAKVAVGLVVVLPTAAMLIRFPAMDLRRERAAYEFEAAVLARAPPGAVILSERDAHTFALWYFQHAQGHRADVVVVDRGLLGYDWYTVQLARRLAASPPGEAFPATEEGDLLQDAKILDRPICRIDADGTGLWCAEPRDH